MNKTNSVILIHPFALILLETPLSLRRFKTKAEIGSARVKRFWYRQFLELDSPENWLLINPLSE
jgi:hypothetical protein